MAKIYNDYVQQSAGSFINWAEIGKDTSKMLKDEVDLREKKKADIDASTLALQSKLAQPPTGTYDAASTKALEFCDAASK